MFAHTSRLNVLVMKHMLLIVLQYMLGFVDVPEKATDLLRHRFPSKVGGAPVGSNASKGLPA